MFYCDTCAQSTGYPVSGSKSQGPCEICGRVAVCNDVPSKYLPSPSQRLDVTATTASQDHVDPLAPLQEPVVVAVPVSAVDNPTVVKRHTEDPDIVRDDPERVQHVVVNPTIVEVRDGDGTTIPKT